MSRNTKRARITTLRNERTIAIRTSSRDPLNVQISAKVRAPKGFKVTHKTLLQAVQFKLAHPKLRDPKGFILRIVSWTNPKRNPDKINKENGLPLNAPRSYGPDIERWNTLRRALQSASMVTRKVGKSK